MSETNNGIEVLAATGGGQAMMAPGGGLSGGKLALATAETDDVLAGKTYYAGDKELKTGTLALADATATESDVASGKTFFAGDNTLKTGALKGYATNPSLSYTANRGESATSGAYGTPFHSNQSGFSRYFVQCTGASVAKIANDKVRVTVNVRGGWACYGYADYYTETSWTFDVTLN